MTYEEATRNGSSLGCPSDDDSDATEDTDLLALRDAMRDIVAAEGMFELLMA
jgi:hypothetical protein